MLSRTSAAVPAIQELPAAKMQSNDDKRRWSDLPNEVVLDIAGAAEFDFAMLCNLQLVDRRLHHVLKTYERSLCKGYAANQLLHVIPYFPDLVSPQCGTREFGLSPSLRIRHESSNHDDQLVHSFTFACADQILWNRWK